MPVCMSKQCLLTRFHISSKTASVVAATVVVVYFTDIKFTTKGHISPAFPSLSHNPYWHSCRQAHTHPPTQTVAHPLPKHTGAFICLHNFNKLLLVKRQAFCLLCWNCWPPSPDLYNLQATNKWFCLFPFSYYLFLPSKLRSITSIQIALQWICNANAYKEFSLSNVIHKKATVMRPFVQRPWTKGGDGDLRNNHRSAVQNNGQHILTYFWSGYLTWASCAVIIRWSRSIKSIAIPGHFCSSFPSILSRRFRCGGRLFTHLAKWLSSWPMTRHSHWYWRVLMVMLMVYCNIIFQRIFVTKHAWSMISKGCQRATS